jgi:hypothetical protein
LQFLQDVPVNRIQLHLLVDFWHDVSNFIDETACYCAVMRLSGSRREHIARPVAYTAISRR